MTTMSVIQGKSTLHREATYFGSFTLIAYIIWTDSGRNDRLAQFDVSPKSTKAHDQTFFCEGSRIV